MAAAADTAQPPYPVRFAVDYPERLDRLTTLLRVLWVIPIAAVYAAMEGLLFLPPLLMILFRQKYPGWWFDWNLALSRFGARLAAYALLLRDEYPSTDEEQAVHLEIDRPDVARDLNRWLPLVKWLLAVPHYVVLFFIGIGAFFAVVIAWFAILFTGRYPRPLFDYVVGVYRWCTRVSGYALLLVTDRYPPFSLH